VIGLSLARPCLGLDQLSQPASVVLEVLVERRVDVVAHRLADGLRPWQQLKVAHILADAGRRPAVGPDARSQAREYMKPPAGRSVSGQSAFQSRRRLRDSSGASATPAGKRPLRRPAWRKKDGVPFQVPMLVASP
jgi:hypothetical protein